MRDDRKGDEAAEFTYEGTDEDETPTATDRTDAGDEPGTEGSSTDVATDAAAAVDAGEPLGDVAGTPADGQSTARADSDDAFAELFEETAVEELDSERVWAQLQSEDTAPSVNVQDREIRKFDKRSYCHQCPHFSEPPAVECGHEGTTILELADVRTFRVANCPVVLEEESLEER